MLAGVLAGALAGAGRFAGPAAGTGDAADDLADAGRACCGGGAGSCPPARASGAGVAGPADHPAGAPGSGVPCVVVRAD
ncbi:hypothetical protein ACT17Q_04585 [Cellulomonas sp. CW35]|uniref:hypothetical protein n=1 Tax=unclassified Cellulomonas TaxID=2620175 RepID=UPI0012FE2507|nr:hypothetical protein [Cellulomonas sp. PSBB021]